MKRPNVSILATHVLLLIAILAGAAHAQMDAPPAGLPPVDGTGPGVFRISGDIGTYGEWYSMRGQEARRPSSSGRLFFRPTVTLFDDFAVNFDFLLSTEGNRAYQNINQFGIHPRWSWGVAHGGDFSMNMSDYTLSGILVRGGGVEINPGLFRFSAIGGYTRRAVAGDISNGAFDRYLWGSKLGIGTDQDGFFDIMVLRVRDDPSSLPPPPAPVTPVFLDTLNPLTTPEVTYVGTPQENLVTGVRAFLNLFDGRLTWRMEADGSLYTRDMRVKGDTALKVPSFITSLYSPNLSSSLDGAGSTEIAMTFGPTSTRLGYRYIGPGYTSLGLGSIVNDLQEFTAATTVRLADWIVALNWTRQNDDLAEQKLYRTKRLTYGANVTFRPAQLWTSVLMANYMNMRNHAAFDSARIRFENIMLGTYQIWAFQPGSLFQTATVMYMYQTSGDDSPLRSASKANIHSASIGCVMLLAEPLTLAPTIGLVRSSVAGAASQSTATYALTLSHRAWEGRLTNSLSTSASFVSLVHCYRTALSSSYRLTNSTMGTLSISSMNYRGRLLTGGTFDEFVASLTFTQSL